MPIICHCSTYQAIQKLVVLWDMSTEANAEIKTAELSQDDFDNGVWVKSKHKEVLDVLNGLTVSQARFVLDIVIEDFTANAVIGSNQLTGSF